MIPSIEKQYMELDAFIRIVKEFNPELPPKDILKNVDFVHNGKKDWRTSDDLNADFREKVTDFIFDSKELKSRALITYLLKAEINYCGAETMMRETLRQLTFMLYSIGEIEDIPLLFEAKMNTCFDAGCGLDIELIFGKDKEKVKDHFRLNPNDDYDIVGCIEDYEQYDVSTPEEFINGMNSYYGNSTEN